MSTGPLPEHLDTPTSGQHNRRVPEVSRLSPEIERDLLQLARGLLVAVRNWSLYPPQHPAVGSAVGRLYEALKSSSFGSAFTIGITPATLLVDGKSADRKESAIAEAAALLHQCDLINITFLGDVPPEAIQTLLRVISLDSTDRRRRGGLARVWTTDGHPSILLEQVDYQEVLARTEDDVAEPAKRDDIWRSIVMSLTAGHKVVLDELEEQRLLAIASSPADIGELAHEVMAPKCTHDGSPMLTSQAVTVLAAFRRIASLASVMLPDRLPQVMSNIATAAIHLDPHVVMELMHSDEDAQGVPVVAGIVNAWDDAKVAHLLASVLALDGQVSDRLATVFSTIAPDEERKRSVLTLTRDVLSRTDFGRSSQFQALWASAEELLISYNDKPFMDDSYRAALDGVGRRAESMAGGGLPSDLPQWMDSIGPTSIRALSVTLFVDLFTLERDPARAGDIAQDMEAFAEELLMAGAYDETRTLTTTLADRLTTAKAIGRDACRQALERLGESVAMRETAALIGEVDKRSWQSMSDVLTTIGPACIEALKPLVMLEHDTLGSERAAALIVGFGAPAVARLESLVTDAQWFVQRNGARLLGRIASPDAVPLLQPLLRRAEPRVARAVVSALCNIDHPSAARAIHTVLRTATGELRRAVVEALVADRDPRVVPILVRIIDESDALGKDHDIVLESLAAMGMVGTDQGVPTIVALIGRRRRFFRRRKLRALKDAGVRALSRIGSSEAVQGLENAARTGDRMLRKIVAQRIQLTI